MENIVNINYAQTGKATNTNPLGMREMQAKAYEARAKQYILLKAPPAPLPLSPFGYFPLQGKEKGK